MNNPLRTVSFVALGLVAGLAIYRYFISAPTTTCCSAGETCALKAPDSIFVNTEQSVFNVNWTEVDGVSKYLVSLYDLNNDTVAADNRLVEGNNTTIQAFAFNQSHTYEVTVASVCSNCIPSAQTARLANCPIIIDDICKLSLDCENAQCNCNTAIPTSAGLVAGEIVFNMGSSGIEMFRVQLSKSTTDPSSAFVFQTYMLDGNRYVCLKNESDDDVCHDESIIENTPRIVSPGCGDFREATLPYDVKITTTQVRIKNIPPGYSVKVFKCTCPSTGF